MINFSCNGTEILDILNLTVLNLNTELLCHLDGVMGRILCWVENIEVLLDNLNILWLLRNRDRRGILALHVLDLLRSLPTVQTLGLFPLAFTRP